MLLNSTHLRINEILAEPVIRAVGHGGAESEEDVGGHGVDPEHEGQGGVEDQISQGLAQTNFQQVIFKPVSDSEGEDDEDKVEKVVDEIAHCYFVNQGGDVSVSAVVDDGNEEEER